MRNGTYNESVDWVSGPGTSGNPITVEAENARAAVWAVPTGEPTALNLLGQSYVTIRGFVFDGTNGRWNSVGQAQYTALEVTGAKDLVSVGCVDSGTPSTCATNIRFENNEFRQSAYGLGLVNALCNQITFSGNFIHHICKVRNCNVLYAGAPNTVFENNTVEDIAGAIAVWNESGSTAHNAIFRNNTVRRTGTFWSTQNGTVQCCVTGACPGGAEGLTCSQRMPQGFSSLNGGLGITRGSGSRIYNNVLEGNAASGISANHNASNCRIENNTIYGNTADAVDMGDLGAGIYLGNTGGGSTNCVVRNNIVYQPGVTNPPPMVNIGSGNTFSNNLCSAGSAGPIGCTVSIPLFVDQSNGDLRLQLDSPAIDTGFDTTATVPTDILGVTRPQGTAVDRGAYEFVGGAPPEPLGNVAWWKFDENTGALAADSTVLGHTLTAQGNATWVTPGAIGGSATRLDGIGDYWTTSLSADLKPLDTFAITGWIRPTADDGEIVSAGDSYGAEVLNGGNLACYFHNGSGFPGAQTSGVNLLDGAWHHFGCVKTPMAMLVYVDGLLRGSQQMTGNISYTLGTQMLVGRSFTVPVTLDYSGDIDHLRLYDGEISQQGYLNDYNEVVPMVGLFSPYTRFYQANAAEGLPLAAIGANITVDQSAKVRMRVAVRNGGEP